MVDSQTTLIRVMALHALAYCERLYYPEEVEEIRVADHRVYAGSTKLDSRLRGNDENLGLIEIPSIVDRLYARLPA